jgi:hypothetical protein
LLLRFDSYDVIVLFLTAMLLFLSYAAAANDQHGLFANKTDLPNGISAQEAEKL